MPIVIRPIDSDGEFISEETISFSVSYMENFFEERYGENDTDSYNNSYDKFFEEMRDAFMLEFMFPVTGFAVAAVTRDEGEEDDMHPDVVEMANRLLPKYRLDIVDMLRALHVAENETRLKLAALIDECERATLAEAIVYALTSAEGEWREGALAAVAQEYYSDDISYSLTDYVDWDQVASDNGWQESTFAGETFTFTG